MALVSHVTDAWRVFEPDGKRFELFSGPDVKPRGALNHMAPRRRVAAHWHMTDEYQVILEGSMVFPDQELSALGVHYADAYGGYGPFASGPEGLLFLMIAPEYGAVDYLEEAPLSLENPHSKLIAEAKLVEAGNMKIAKEGSSDPSGAEGTAPRQELVEADDVPWRPSSFEGGSGRAKTLIGGEEHGPRVELVQAEAGSTIPIVAPTGVEFHLVVEGACTSAGEKLVRHSVRHCDAGEAAAPLVAGADGVTVMLLRFGNS